jgi:hypothetical protein
MLLECRRATEAWESIERSDCFAVAQRGSDQFNSDLEILFDGGGWRPFWPRMRWYCECVALRIGAAQQVRMSLSLPSTKDVAFTTSGTIRSHDRDCGSKQRH